MDKKELIINTAYDQFVKSGYESATIEKIAKAAGISKGSIYTYFRSKDIIFYEALKRISEKISGLINALALTGNKKEDIYNISFAIYTYLSEHQSDYVLYANKDAIQKLVVFEDYISPFTVLDDSIFNKLQRYSESIEFAKCLRAMTIDISGDFFISKVEKTTKDFKTIVYESFIDIKGDTVVKNVFTRWDKVLHWLVYIFGIAIVFGIVLLILDVVLFLSGKV